MDDNNSLSGFPFNGKILLLSDRDSTFWTSDGTAGATTRMSTVKVDNNGAGAAILNNTLYFAGLLPATGSELWKTDGTELGTTLVADILPGITGSQPDDFFTFNNKLYFTGNTPSAGRELYQYTGSGSPTVITDLNPGEGSSFYAPHYYSHNNMIYFEAENGTGTALYVLKTSGISKLMDFPDDFAMRSYLNYVHVGNTIYFHLISSNHIGNLYKTDGTASGTSLIRAFDGFYSSYTFQMVSFNNKLIFTATDYELNTELWSTDGTTTKMIKDINPGEEGSSPQLFNSVILNNRLIFSAATENSGDELWSTDGTSEGTSMLIDINPTAGEGSSPVLMPILRTFDYSDPSYHGMDFYNRSANFNGYIFFEVDDGSDNIQLWTTNGTAPGTTFVKTLNTKGYGFGGSYIYTRTGIIFSGNDGTNGTQPWISDGTSAGTKPISIINTTGDSDPQFEFIWKGDIYMVADNGNGGLDYYEDYYKLQGTYSPLPVSLINFSAIANNLNVQLTWSTATENNSNYFNVERSIDGINFSAIGKVGAAGLSSSVRSYAYADIDAYNQGVSQLYYRLHTIDKDGRFGYSKVESVILNSLSLILKVYPNPAQDLLEIQYNALVKSRINIIDLNGKLYYQATVSESPIGIHKVNVSNFPAGIYIIKFVSDGNVITQKLVIK